MHIETPGFTAYHCFEKLVLLDLGRGRKSSTHLDSAVHENSWFVFVQAIGVVGGGETPVHPLDIHPVEPEFLNLEARSIKDFNYFLLILRPNHLNGMLFLARF